MLIISISCNADQLDEINKELPKEKIYNKSYKENLFITNRLFQEKLNLALYERKECMVELKKCSNFELPLSTKFIIGGFVITLGIGFGVGYFIFK